MKVKCRQQPLNDQQKIVIFAIRSLNDLQDKKRGVSGLERPNWQLWQVHHNVIVESATREGRGCDRPAPSHSNFLSTNVPYLQLALTVVSIFIEHL